MRIHLLAGFCISVLVACGDPERSIETPDLSAQGATHEEQCTDVVHCETTQVARLEVVTKPAQPEQQPSSAPPSRIGGGAAETVDADGDGVPADRDCDESNPHIYWTAPEVQCDGIDQNCDGVDTCDRDLDGYVDAIDCDPSDPATTNQCLAPETGKQRL